MSAKRQADVVEVSPLMDFRAQDDAWYSVRLRLEGDKLLIMYCDFPQESDEVYSVQRFTNIESVEEFRKRFRLASSQLQDKNCDVVEKGMMVCAANRIAVDDLRFFDATVESNHRFSNNSFLPPASSAAASCHQLLLQQLPATSFFCNSF